MGGDQVVNREGKSKGRRSRSRLDDPEFWRHVDDEVSVESIDWHDFALFMSAEQLPVEPRPTFTAHLREHLRRLVKRRYAS